MENVKNKDQKILICIVQSNDNANCAEPDMKFTFGSYLRVLESKYNFEEHVATDIGIDEWYIPVTSLKNSGKSK